jgi:glycosyltransferase involved in cell wall biosynthesis
MGPFPIPNRLLPVHLAKAMPDWVVETFDIKPVVRRQPLTLFVNLFFMLKEHGRNLATRRITPWQAFFTTTWMFEQMSAISCRWIEQGDCLASIQIQSLFDASTAGRPHFVYTDHTHLENLRYPDFDPRKLRGPAWLELERKLYASTTRLLTRSSNVAASMIEDYGADPERTLVVGSGSNVDFGSAWVERADRPASQGVRILFVGKDWTRKGGLDLLKAFGRVHAEHPETRLVVVGPTDLPPAPGPRPPASRPWANARSRSCARSIATRPSSACRRASSPSVWSSWRR